MSITTRQAPHASDTVPLTDPHHLRLGTAALAVGLLSQLPLGLAHPHEEYANDSVAAFHEYAHSGDWVLVHLGQFLGLLLATVGLVAVAAALARHRGVVGILGLAAGVAAVVSAAVFAVQMAVDGVALKAAVDAWEAAGSGTDRAAAFGVADSVRSVEKGLSALFNVTNGLTLVSLGSGLALRGGRGHLLGWLATGAGAGLLAVGVLTAHTGFSREASSVALPVSVALVVFGVGMLVTTWRRPDVSPAATAS
jgi:hypothetical protein